MRHIRFVDPRSGEPRTGRIEGEWIGTHAQKQRLEDVELLSPCVPSKIVCVGRNYVDHATELGNDVPTQPLLFLKPPSAVIGPGAAIVLPESDTVHYEAELAVVIGRRCRNVKAAESADVILGYTCLNDISDRMAQQWETNWVRAKAFDTSAPLGPAIVSPEELTFPLDIELRLNGAVRQKASTADMIFSVPRLIETITSFMTLEPGDVIATGTPAGVGALSAGDLVEVEIQGIGTLRNPVLGPTFRETKRSE